MTTNKTKNTRSTAPKKSPKIKTKPDNMVKSLMRFLQAMSEVYKLDDLFPGVTFSFLPDQGTYYASLCRYDRHEGTRTVMLNVKHETIEGCLDELIAQWFLGNKATMRFMKENVRHPHGQTIRQGQTITLEKALQLSLKRIHEKGRLRP